MQKGTKPLILFGTIAVFPILWALVWHFALSYIPIFPFLLFDYHGGWFGAWISAVACAVISLTRADYRKVSIILSLAFLAIWLYPSVTMHYDLMSWQGLYDYDWVQRVHLVPFGGKFIRFITSVIFPFATMYDAPLNLMPFLVIGLLVAGRRHKAIWFGGFTVGCVLIELAQLVTRIGCCDTNDICYRVIGMAIGLGIGVLITRRAARKAGNASGLKNAKAVPSAAKI